MVDHSTRGISVVVPARNAASTLRQCLQGIRSQLSSDDELVLVDDHSDDGSAEIAAGFDAIVIRMPRHAGVSAARNFGALHASKEVLFFLDADVVLMPGGLCRARSVASAPGFEAAVGSYDDSPFHSSTVSMFKNLAHHFFHQNARGEISSFWAGCGLVSRRIFNRMGGFDEDLFFSPSIEDVEFGWRLSDALVRVSLDPGLQVTHLKRWTLRSLLATDIFYRAVPWTILSLQRGRRLSFELNLSKKQRIATVVAVLLAGTAALTPLRAGFALVATAIAVLAVCLNVDLLKLFQKKGGVRLMLAGFCLQQLYYLYSSFGMLLGFAIYSLGGSRQYFSILSKGSERD
jgi:glycosyltransferase involved in cell wall biosynthesis